MSVFLGLLLPACGREMRMQAVRCVCNLGDPCSFVHCTVPIGCIAESHRSGVCIVNDVKIENTDFSDKELIM